MIIDLKLTLSGEMNIEYDTTTNTYRVISQSLKAINPNEKNTWNEHVINSSEAKYFALTIGGKSKVGNSIPIDTQISMVLLDEEENVENLGIFKSHKQTRGRIDGLKQLYKELDLHEGTSILLRYNQLKNTLEIKKG